MGEIKTYMVVTNDEYEHIVKADLKGAISQEVLPEKEAGEISNLVKNM